MNYTRASRRVQGEDKGMSKKYREDKQSTNQLFRIGLETMLKNRLISLSSPSLFIYIIILLLMLWLMYYYRHTHLNCKTLKLRDWRKSRPPSLRPPTPQLSLYPFFFFVCLPLFFPSFSLPFLSLFICLFVL